jgi:hypothetical protein
MFSEEQNNESESPIERELSPSGESERSQSSRKAKEQKKEQKPARKPKAKAKAKKPESTEPEIVFLLVNTSDKSCETYAEDDLETAGAKLINDKKTFRLFKAVELSPKISFEETAQL